MAPTWLFRASCGYSLYTAPAALYYTIMTDNPKHTIREQARYHRDHLQVDQADYERVIDIFFKNVTPQSGQIIAGYWPVGREFDVRFLMDELIQRGFQCALPCVIKNTKILAFKAWTPDCLMLKGAFDVFEPDSDELVEPDIFLCPLLAFDRQGYRMGQGGGYYDATLEHSRAQKDILAIGVGYGEQAVLFNLPNEAHDQKMDIILTPQKILDFRK